MFRKWTVVILLTVFFMPVKVHGQQDGGGRQTSTIVGQVIKTDPDGGVVSVMSGAVDKQAVSNAHLDADLLWKVLIKNGYIDPSGTIQAPFYLIDKFSNMGLPQEFRSKKKLIYTIFKNALADNGQMRVFSITFTSELLQGAHDMTSIDIQEGDPVIILYDSPSPDKNEIIRLVDDKPDDD